MGQKNKKLSPFGWTSADAFALCGSVRRQGRLAPQARASTLFNRKKEKNKMRSLEKRIKPAVASSKDVFSLVHSRLHKLEVEHLLVLHLDSKHRLTKLQTVSQGTRTECLVHPREVFCEAVRERSVAVIVCHNHPSGDAEPSRQDLDLTTRLFRAGELLGIPLLDHLIVGKGIYLSLADIGFLGESQNMKAMTTNCRYTRLAYKSAQQKSQEPKERKTKGEM